MLLSNLTPQDISSYSTYKVLAVSNDGKLHKANVSGINTTPYVDKLIDAATEAVPSKEELDAAFMRLYGNRGSLKASSISGTNVTALNRGGYDIKVKGTNAFKLRNIGNLPSFAICQSSNYNQIDIRTYINRSVLKFDFGKVSEMKEFVKEYNTYNVTTLTFKDYTFPEQHYLIPSEYMNVPATYQYGETLTSAYYLPVGYINVDAYAHDVTFTYNYTYPLENMTYTQYAPADATPYIEFKGLTTYNVPAIYIDGTAHLICKEI